MLILLPPSEGKAAVRSGAPLDLARLALPALTPAREHVLDALVALCAGPDPQSARAALGLGPGLAGEVTRNAGLRRAPTTRAGRLYTGVLYEALDLATLAPPAARLARRSVLVLSALWGALRLDDRVPAYRCPVTARLPGLGGLGAYWRRATGPALTAAAGTGPVLDLRSTGYAAMWRPGPDLAPRTAEVRVLHERPVDGTPQRSVVSHFNKATKGRLVRDLLAAGAAPRSLAELVGALRDLKYRVEEQPGPAAGPRRLDVVVTEL